MTVVDTSRQAHDRISLRSRKSLGDQIEGVVSRACRSGRRDMSMREVQVDLERLLERRVDVSTISARVNELVAAKRLVRDQEHTRACSISGQQIHPLTARLGQPALFN